MIEAALAFVFGLLIGSFLNVCIYRWPQDLSVVRPGSLCISCEEHIAWYDNIPLLSYFLLGGKCRYCKVQIPIRYPIVEGLTGLVFLHFWLKSGPSILTVKSCLFASLLIGLIFSDAEYRILPDEFTLVGALLGLILAGFSDMPSVVAPILGWTTGWEFTGIAASFVESIIGALVPALFLWLAGVIYQRLRRREGLGFGDVKLMAMTGAFMGLSGSLLTLFAGSLAGSILGYGYIRLKRLDPSAYELPFGTFLGAAALLISLFGRL